MSTLEQLKEKVEKLQQTGVTAPAAFGVGLATYAIADLSAPQQIGEQAAVLDTWYPQPCLDEAAWVATLFAGVVGYKSGTASYRLPRPQLDALVLELAPLAADARCAPVVRAVTCLRDTLLTAEADAERYPTGSSLDRVLPRAVVVTFVGALDGAPVDAHDAYLRLHLLSTRKVRPHGLNLDGMFGKLTNVVWTNLGPFATDDFELTRAVLQSQGRSVHVHSIDKFPRMTDYVVPTGVRIADADRVRLGAHLASGTTVMHEGFCNFNAGTLGNSMVEGRITAGVVVGDGSDIGGGASIMGTLSGGGKTVNSIGERCLIGANGGCGIPLGNNCTIEAGLYVTGGTVVTTADGEKLKALHLAGKDNLLFRRNSVSGTVEVLEKRNEVALNEELHKN